MLSPLYFNFSFILCQKCWFLGFVLTLLLVIGVSICNAPFFTGKITLNLCTFFR